MLRLCWLLSFSLFLSLYPSFTLCCLLFVLLTYAVFFCFIAFLCLNFGIKIRAETAASTAPCDGCGSSSSSRAQMRILCMCHKVATTGTKTQTQTHTHRARKRRCRKLRNHKQNKWASKGDKIYFYISAKARIVTNDDGNPSYSGC